MRTARIPCSDLWARVGQERIGRTATTPPRAHTRVVSPPKRFGSMSMSSSTRVNASSSSSAPGDASPYVWYASFGSNILLERFECYLRGGRIDGMVRDMPGSRDPTPPLASTFWVDVPHRLFFAHSSPTWAGGGVAFMDVDTLVDPTMATAFRLYRVTLEQFNDVLAQENGMTPGDPGCRELTVDDANRLAESWTELQTNKNGSDVIHAGTTGQVGPAAEMRAPSELWYGYAKCLGVKDGEAVLTFTCDASELNGFRSGLLPTNPPCDAYVDVIARGLMQCGLSEDEARGYLNDRVEAPMTNSARV